MKFEHQQHAHCESGVITNLLKFNGVRLSEPMVFGIGAGLFFAHIPFVKVSGVPGTTFRTWPGAIFKRVMQRLQIKYEKRQFHSPQKAMLALDNALEAGIPVGLLTSVYFLPYLPEAFRFHFNAHNILVYGKENNRYLVSDPVMEGPTTIAPEDLIKARFAKGMPEPKGMMYSIKQVPQNLDINSAVSKGIKQTCFFMLSPPLPWFGNNAIFLLANKIAQYAKKLTPRKSSLYLGNIIRMQEEIGTGGAGFRFLYAAFLQEVSSQLQNPQYQNFAQELTKIGDSWRNFAYLAARFVKSRTTEQVTFQELKEILTSIGTSEKDFFIRLQKFIKLP